MANHDSDFLETKKGEGSAEEEIKNIAQKLKEPELKIAEIMAMQFSSGGNPLLKKLDGSHITQVLKLAEKSDERQYTLLKNSQEYEFSTTKSTQFYLFWVFIVTVFMLCLILYLFQEKPDILIPILTGIGGIVSGFLAGWGYGRKQSG